MADTIPIILSDVQQKDIEEAKKKAELDARIAFEKDLEVLCTKHQRLLFTYLSYAPTGITAQVTSVPAPDKKK